MIEREQVLAFRLNSHHLTARLQPGSLLRAAGACGIQNSPPGSAALSLHARVTGLFPEDIQHTLYVEKSLLQTWSMRGAPYLFPTQDRQVFTHGLLPVDEGEIRAFIPGVEPALEKIGITAVEVGELTAAELLEALDQRELTKDELGRDLAIRVSQRLSLQQQSAWAGPSWYAPGQSLGESVIRFFLPVVALQGLCCHTVRRNHKAYLGRLDQWLGGNKDEGVNEIARAELARRFLHVYGPSTVKGFAGWAGISLIQAAAAWQRIEDELEEVTFEKGKTWLLQRDKAGLIAPPPSSGIRFLPPHDPYLLMRDKATLIPDKGTQRRVWRSAGSPGAVLADGEFIATWRSSKKPNRLLLTVETFSSLSPDIRSQIEMEAGSLFQYWNCKGGEVRFLKGN